MDRTLAKGPIVAASSGIAVEANHQSLKVEDDHQPSALVHLDG